uniref:Uncharacterized protein n=1 Tax=Ipomoea trifida TaxID=35884 RepID=A0PAB6_IPOTF|nr:hypothetical protein [Ipomoea trifida]
MGSYGFEPQWLENSAFSDEGESRPTGRLL